MMERIWLLTIVLLASVCDSARILVFQPTGTRSHYLAVVSLFEELAARGHQLTLVTRFPHKTPVSNLHEIDLSNKVPVTVNNFSFELITKEMRSPFKTPFLGADVEYRSVEKVLQEAAVRQLLDSDEKFDLVMAETFAIECFAAVAYKFKAPLITFVTSSALPWVADRTGLPDNPSYIPNYFSPFSSVMTFKERLYNTIILVFTKLVHRYYVLPRVQHLINTYIGDSFPPVEDLLKNTSLVLVNSHFSFSLSRPFPPNVIEIGGIQIKNSSVKLPKDLQEILDRSSQGVILVSFGSLFRTSTIPKDIIQKFLSVFSTIPQTIIFKYEDPLPNVPANVFIRNWLPQREIIEHKNVKIFLGHGGLASTMEAVYFAKPLIGIPFFADQHLNIQGLVQRGAGLMLDLDSLSEQAIHTAIKEVLNNPVYLDNMRRLSLQLRDRPQTPMETAVFWIEYVIRHQGAHHLRPASVKLPLYQHLLLDVLLVVLIPVLVLLYLIYFLFFRAVEVSPNDQSNYELKKDH